jgi:phospholipase/lecithinase/hemolysin
VYEYFKEKKEESKRNHKQAQKLKHNTHLNTITYEALQYLQGTPCAVQTDEAINEFMTQLQPYGLTKAEKLIILNIVST